MHSDKNATDKTKTQLLEGIRKSKAAGATPARSGESARPAAQKPSSRTLERGEYATGYALGGLRWPD